MRKSSLVLAILFSSTLWAQESPPQEAPFINEPEIDQELDSVNGPPVKVEQKAEPKQVESPPPPPPEVADPDDVEVAADSLPTPQPKPTPLPAKAVAPAESPKVEATRKPIIPVSPKVNTNQAEEFHPSEPQFVKPPAPLKGGVVRVPHPNAAKGLLRINQDGSYQYAIGIKPKSQSASFRLGSMSPPKITGGDSAAGTLTYETMYGKSNLIGATFEYEWQPFTGFGRLGLNLGTGFYTSRGNGYFKNARTGSDPKAEEIYTLYIVPASIFLTYRFEYARRQKIIPYINGGGTYYGLVESRDDGKSPDMTASTAVGGGGGLLFSITAWDHAGAFSLDREYGIADMYFVLEARIMQGLDKTVDFSTQSINGGITVDF